MIHVLPDTTWQAREEKPAYLCGVCMVVHISATTDSSLVKSRGKRFESARRLSLIGVDKPISLRMALHFPVTLRHAKGWFAHCANGSFDHYL